MLLISKILQSKITAICFTIITFILFSLPSKAFHNAPNLSDKLVHSLLFFMVTVLWLLCSKSEKWIYISCIFYGILVEVWQANLPKHFHRGGDWKDAAFDALGVLMAWLGFYFYKKLKINSFTKIK